MGNANRRTRGSKTKTQPSLTTNNTGAGNTGASQSTTQPILTANTGSAAQTGVVQPINANRQQQGKPAHARNDRSTPPVTRVVRKKNHLGDVTISTSGIERTQMTIITGTAPSGAPYYNRRYPFEPASGAFDSCDQFLMTDEERDNFMKRSRVHLVVDMQTVAISDSDNFLVGTWDSLPNGFKARIERLIVTIEVPEDSQSFESQNTPFTKETLVWKFLVGLMAKIKAMQSLKHLEIVIRGTQDIEQFGTDAHAVCTIPIFYLFNKVKFWLKYQQNDNEPGSIGQDAFTFMRRAYKDIEQSRS